MPDAPVPTEPQQPTSAQPHQVDWPQQARWPLPAIPQQHQPGWPQQPPVTPQQAAWQEELPTPPQGWPALPQPQPQPQPAAGRQPATGISVKRPGITLIVLGVLGLIAGIAFIALLSGGDLEDVLEDAGYEIAVGVDTFTFLLVVQVIFAALALGAGIAVLRRSQVGRVLGIVVAVVGVAGGIFNFIMLTNPLTVVIVVLYVAVIADLARLGRAFARR